VFLAFIFLIAWPIAELYVIVRVAEAIGVLLTIVLLIAACPLGWWATRSVGAAAWRRLRVALAEGRPPGREVLDGALVVLGGGLLIVPGFISDAIGLLLLFPLTRAPLRALLVRNFRSRLVVQAGRFGGRPGGGQRPGAGPRDVEGTATEVDPPQIRP
jgi:UPF0716 protein FxsA